MWIGWGSSFIPVRTEVKQESQFIRTPCCHSRYFIDICDFLSSCHSEPLSATTFGFVNPVSGYATLAITTLIDFSLLNLNFTGITRIETRLYFQMQV